MKIVPTTTINQTNYLKSKRLKGTNNNIFRGGGKQYSEEVIALAKKALKNPNWKSELIARKMSLGETLSSWHEREGVNDIATRVIMGICTLGITEITWGMAYRAMDARKNKRIDKLIKDVEDCINDLGNGSL